MKPFDLNLAKKKHPVQTRDGRSVRILCFDRKDIYFPIVALMPEKEGDKEREAIVSYTTEGKVCSGCATNSDLFMVSTKKEGWINIYDVDGERKVGNLHKSKEDAKYSVEENDPTYIKTIKIEWEE